MIRLRLIGYLESSMSIAPPPATTESFCIARLKKNRSQTSQLEGNPLTSYLTIMMASWRDLSVSSMNCSAPPRRMIVQDWDLGHPWKRLNLGTWHVKAMKIEQGKKCFGGWLMIMFTFLHLSVSPQKSRKFPGSRHSGHAQLTESNHHRIS